MSVFEPPPQRQRLASVLRRLRLDADLTTTALGERLGISQTRVSRLELGRVTPTGDIVDTWARATGAPDGLRAELLALVETVEAEAVEWRTVLRRRSLPDLQVDVAEMEASAGRVATYTPLLVPGLMQTPEYTRRIYAARWPDRRPDAVEAIARRMDRQRILYEEGRRLEFVVGEAALRRRFGPPAAIREQLNRILTVAGLDTVTLGVLPLDTDLATWGTHQFNLFDDRAGDEPALVHVELLTAGVNVTQPDDVEEYRTAFTRLLAASATGDQAEAIVHAVEDALLSRPL
jgi:transcriptional regulator with XRE-family HTH domain